MGGCPGINTAFSFTTNKTLPQGARLLGNRLLIQFQSTSSQITDVLQRGKFSGTSAAENSAGHCLSSMTSLTFPLIGQEYLPLSGTEKDTMSG